jgi:dienelactone hydrolase
LAKLQAASCPKVRISVYIGQYHAFHGQSCALKGISHEIPGSMAHGWPKMLKFTSVEREMPETAELKK